MYNDFLRVATVVTPVALADPKANRLTLESYIRRLSELEVDVAVFPELFLTGYTCGDLFHDETLLEACELQLSQFREIIADMADDSAAVPVLIFGCPVKDRVTGVLRNKAIILTNNGHYEVSKTYLPNYNEFYEQRWFRERPQDEPLLLLDLGKAKIGVEICEDLWTPIPPSTHLAMGGADVVFNLSASDDLVGKYSYLRSLVKQQSARCLCGYVYVSAGRGESSTDLVFDGKGIIAECGRVLAEKPRWTPEEDITVADIDLMAISHERRRYNTFDACAVREGTPATVAIAHNAGTLLSTRPLKLERPLSRLPFVPSAQEGPERLDEILHIQCAGLQRRLEAVHSTRIVVGISGGLDSTLALLVAVKTLDMMKAPRTDIIGVTMPGFGTTSRTHTNALALMQQLGVTVREVSIAAAVTQHFLDIGHDPAVHDVTYENSQARERTQILMDIANQTGGIVLGTGDLSELALGWATYNGDHMSMYAVNASVPKTLVASLVHRVAQTLDSPEARATLLDILDTPISPELLPGTAQGEIAQKTEDLVGPYELHDFFLYYVLRFGFTPGRVLLLARHAFKDAYPDEEILKWLRVFYRRFFAQQFKRSCMPDGPKVGTVCLSPRGDWRMPSDALSAAWLRELDTLQ